MQPGDNLEIAKAFIPDIELPQNVLNKLAEIADMGLQDETSGGGIDLLLQTLHGDPVGTLTDKLNGTDATAQLHDKLTAEPGVETLMDKLGGGLKKLFSKDSLTFSGHPLQGRTKIHGMDISIENKKGSVRKGTDKDGHSWETKMNFDYGYIRGTVGKDKDHLDVYLGPNEKSDKVFIVHQNDPVTDKYDEDKCMVGFNSAKEAKAAYLKQYDRPGFFCDMVEMNIDDFKAHIFSEEKRVRK